MILASQDGPKMSYMHMLRFERYIKSKAGDREKNERGRKIKEKKWCKGLISHSESCGDNLHFVA